MNKTSVRVVNKSDLDKERCHKTGCTHDHSAMYLSGDCHIGAPVHCKYVKEDAQLAFECGVCGSPIVNIQLRD